MPRTALLLLVVYLALGFGLRSWLQWRYTGSTGFRGISGAPGSAEWWGGVLFIAALLALLLAPVADLRGWLPRAPALDVAPVRALGIVGGPRMDRSAGYVTRSSPRWRWGVPVWPR